MEDFINICYITDANYVQHTMVSIASLLANRGFCTKYRVFMICDRVDERLKSLICNLFRNTDSKLEIIDHNNAYQKKSYELGKYISSSTYIRLNLPSILNGIDKVIYLDGDTIIQEDLGKLYGIDIEGKAIAGSLDFGVCIDSINWKPVEYIRKTLPNYNKHYFNAGVLAMNLAHLRETDFEKTCKNLYDQRKDFIFADQDILNYAIPENKKVRFSIYWNCPVLSLALNYSQFPDLEMKMMIERTYHVTYDRIMDIAFRSAIIHINGSKTNISKIPYLDSMYRRYLDMALSYSKRS